MDDFYDLRDLNLPRLGGWGLGLMTRLLENPFSRRLLAGRLLRDGGVMELRALELEEAPEYYPRFPRTRITAQPGDPPALPPSGRVGLSPFITVDDYAAAYRDGGLTPLTVAERLLESVAAADRRDPPLRPFIACQPDDLLEQARAATRRFREGRPLGPLDGVPVAIKDEVDQAGYPTTLGTVFLGSTPAREDSTVVARLRAAGALLPGKTNMHEIGLGVTGLNVHHGTPRNPYDPSRYPGGSSSGSAVAVAAGLCPLALGADGGGSIRIPAAFCGLVGLKTTFGRVSSAGKPPLAWTVGSLGPMAATVRDAALGYAVLAGPDSHDPHTLRQPPVSLEGLERPDLKDLILGVCWPWFEHADPSVVAACRELLSGLEATGARLVEVNVPGLEAARVAHAITIAGEMSAALAFRRRRHGRKLGAEIRFNLALADTFTARDYLKAQRVRARFDEDLGEALARVDVVVSPATACVAPPVRAAALAMGESDLGLLTRIMRFAFPANLAGLPAVTLPAGYDSTGLPIGFQAMGRPWREDILLRIARVAEGLAPRCRGAVYYDLINNR